MPTSISIERPTIQSAFARHESFHLRDRWIYKGLQAIQADGFALYCKAAHHDLGVGINILRAILYWLQATNLIEIIRPNARPKQAMVLTAV